MFKKDLGENLIKMLREEKEKFIEGIFDDLIAIKFELFLEKEGCIYGYRTDLPLPPEGEEYKVKFSKNPQMIILNSRFFGICAGNCEADFRMFSETLYHELAHYYAKRYNLLEDGKIENVCNKNKDVMQVKYHILGGYNENSVPSEIFASATSMFRINELKLEDNDELNNELYY